MSQNTIRLAPLGLGILIRSIPCFGCVPWSDAKLSHMPARSLREWRRKEETVLTIKVDDFTGVAHMFFLTHAHSDHMGGLTGKNNWKRYVETIQHRILFMLQGSCLSLFNTTCHHPQA